MATIKKFIQNFITKFKTKKSSVPKKSPGSLIKRLAFGFGVAILLFILFCLSLFVYYAKDLPRPEKFTEREFTQSTKIYDRTGKTLLYELYGDQKREIVPLTDVPQYLQQAIIATEDANFYKHHGIDFRAIARSIWADISLGKPAFGASTISQQLIRSTFLSTEKTVQRKVREIILTLELERRYSKNQILEWYVNQIPFGPNLYGVESASQTFFGKSTKDLTINEAATLAALIQAPSYLSPYGGHKDELIARKNYVLDRMVAEHYLDKSVANTLKTQEVKFADIQQPIKAPNFVFYVQDYLLNKYGQDYLQNQGLKVYTTLDWDMQQKAEATVKKGAENNKKYGAYNAALVALDPKTGEILSMVGSADYWGDPLPKDCKPGITCLFDPKVNVATYNIGRQPGSSFKPFVYATAFEKGYDDNYVVVDEQTDFGIWGGKSYVPQNFDGRFRGPVTLRQALAQSLNVPSVKVLVYLAGIPDSIATAKRMGITTLTQPLSYYGPSLVLGGGEVKLLDMVSAYGVFATGGMRMPATSILKIEDANGNVIEQNDKTPRQILEPRTCQIINSILSDNSARAPIFGVNNVMNFTNDPTHQVAAKTGTTSDYRDGWILGYTPDIAVGVWTGNSNNIPMKAEPGSVIAGPIWRSFMDQILPSIPSDTFTKSVSPETPEPASSSASPSDIGGQ